MIYQSVTALYSGKATRSFEYRKASERKKKRKKKEKEKLHEFGWELLPHPPHSADMLRGNIIFFCGQSNTFFFFFSFFFRGQETLEIPTRTSWKLQRKLLVFTRVSHICPANRLLRTGRHMSDNNSNNGKFFITSNARWNKY